MSFLVLMNKIIQTIKNENRAENNHGNIIVLYIISNHNWTIIAILTPINFVQWYGYVFWWDFEAYFGYIKSRCQIENYFQATKNIPVARLKFEYQLKKWVGIYLCWINWVKSGIANLSAKVPKHYAIPPNLELCYFNLLNAP